MFSIIDMDPESQEAKGASEFVAAENKLPRTVHAASLSTLEGKDLYAKLGIEVIGESNDPLFYDIKLPSGWTIMPTPHSMWTEVWDDKNRPRINVFFKASFHDRRAYASLQCRYQGLRFWPENNEDRSYYYIQDTSTKTIIYSTQDLPSPEHEGKEMSRYDQQQYQVMISEEWMDKHYPKWKEFNEYWD